MSKILLANITWNPFGWRNDNYINPKAGHQYAKQNVGGESLNFHFNKKSVDTPKFIHGFIQWTHAPVEFDNGGLIFFYTRNTDINKSQIVGVYGKAKIFNEVTTHKVEFQKKDYGSNVKAEKKFSLLFPLPLEADNYKNPSDKRIVGMNGFKYRNEEFAERILFDELTELSKAGTNEKDFNKLVAIYELYIGKEFKVAFTSNDEKEQEELERFYKKNKSKADIIKDLKSLTDTDQEEVSINYKTYKRDNRTIAQIKILRDFKCQICSTFITKRDGSKYIEAAHIKPKCQQGRETPDNIILLSPNHHKEFDFGHLEIKLHNTQQIDFVLNGQRHRLKLSIE